jgi:hypothetical protein
MDQEKRRARWRRSASPVDPERAEADRVKQYELRNPENAQRILELIADGLSMTKVALVMGCEESAIRKWAREDDEFGTEYALARDHYHEAIASQLIELSDEARSADPSLTNAYRLAIDTRKWVLAKMLPKKYGDQLNVEHFGTVTVVPVDYSRAVVEGDPELKLLDLEPTEFEETESAV